MYWWVDFLLWFFTASAAIPHVFAGRSATRSRQSDNAYPARASCSFSFFTCLSLPNAVMPILFWKRKPNEATDALDDLIVSTEHRSELISAVQKAYRKVMGTKVEVAFNNTIAYYSKSEKPKVRR